MHSRSTATLSTRRLAGETGYTLVATIILLAFLAALAGAAFTLTSSSNAMSNRARDVALVEAAADGAMEDYYAQFKKLIISKNYSSISNATLASSLTAPAASRNPAFGTAGISFSSQSVVLADPWGYPLDSSNPNGYTSESLLPAGGFFVANLDNYPGWSGQAFYYKASAVAAKAQGAGIRGRNANVSLGLNRYFQTTSVPLFQALIYFEEDLELHPGDDMTLDGKVHTNSDAWCIGYAHLQFNGSVSYVGTYNETVSPERHNALGTGSDPTNPPYWADGQQSGSSTTKATQLTQVSRIEPFGTAPATLFNTTDTNQDNDSFHELIEPEVNAATDPTAIKSQRIPSKATVTIRIDSSKATTGRVTVTATNGATLTTTQKTAFANAVGSTVSLFDRREGKSVSTTSVDMAKLNTAVTAAAGTTSLATATGYNGVVYIDDVASGVNAVRLQNGAEIVQDLTVVSQDPVYVQGDFNTGGGYADSSLGTSHNPAKVPANVNNDDGTNSTVATNYTKKSVAVIGDAVMILSNNWNDGNASKTLSSRTATNTTVNAAILAGYLPTDYQNNNSPGGGAHNLVRFLENWNSKTFSYSGAMVQTYVSQQYQGLWDTGQIYSPPMRWWSFDTNFLRNPPPGSVNAFIASRGRWNRFVP